MTPPEHERPGDGSEDTGPATSRGSPAGKAPEAGPTVKWEGPHSFVSALPPGVPPVAAAARERVSTGWPSLPLHPSRAATRLEVGLALTGLALVGFMMSHMILLFSSVLGASKMDALATFLEKYYLLQLGAPVLMLIILGHIVLAVRKLPNTARQQMALVKHVRTLKHFDTWTWMVQIVTGLALLILVSIHLWVVLTDLPIEALKSGTRINGVYLWFYIPFLLLVEAHASAGLYRISVKWDLVRRSWAHKTLLIYTGVFLTLGMVVLYTFWKIGAPQ